MFFFKHKCYNTFINVTLLEERRLEKTGEVQAMRFEPGNDLGNKFQPGVSGNPAGKPKGSKHISTWIQEMVEDEEFTTYIQDARDGYIEYKGAPMRAIVKSATIKAIAGDKDARDWLAKYGYKKEIDVTSNGDSIVPILVKFVGEDVKRIE